MRHSTYFVVVQFSSVEDMGIDGGEEFAVEVGNIVGWVFLMLIKVIVHLFLSVLIFHQILVLGVRNLG